jgi:hypothetical protein
VSLTKHGAHKVATLLKNYDANTILKHVTDRKLGIKINSSQAKKNLSANSRGKLPGLWEEAQRQGSETIDALVLVAIIFSHHKLISVMQRSSGKHQFSGTIKRRTLIDGKAFTNLAHIIEELGYSTEHSVDHISYDLHKLFQIKELNKFVAKILALKLETAGWDKKNSVADESISLGLHKVFSVTKDDFRAWLSTGELSDLKVLQEEAEDLDFFFKGNDKPASTEFNFQAGHSSKKTGAVKVAPSTKESTAILLHNEIQNVLYAKLVKEFGEDNVGTEIGTGQGTSIDIVVKTGKFCWFYEIKTAPTVRACIRQAIPQLLEYAYWHGKDDRADRLIVVSPLPITKEADTYLTFLRENFQLKIYYQQYEADKKKE